MLKNTAFPSQSRGAFSAPPQSRGAFRAPPSVQGCVQGTPLSPGVRSGHPSVHGCIQGTPSVQGCVHGTIKPHQMGVSAQHTGTACGVVAKTFHHILSCLTSSGFTLSLNPSCCSPTWLPLQPSICLRDAWLVTPVSWHQASPARAHIPFQRPLSSLALCIRFFLPKHQCRLLVGTLYVSYLPDTPALILFSSATMASPHVA